MGFTKVRSLIDGIAGIANGQSGNLVGPTTVLTTVSQLDPVKVYFALGEGEYFKFAKPINQAAMNVTGPPRERRLIQLVLSEGTTYGKPGKLYLVRPASGSANWHHSGRSNVPQS